MSNNYTKGLNDYVSNRIIEYLKEHDDALIKLNDKIDKIQNNLNMSAIFMCDECKLYFTSRYLNKCDNCSCIYCKNCKKIVYCEDCDVCEDCFINDKKM